MGRVLKDLLWLLAFPVACGLSTSGTSPADGETTVDGRDDARTDGPDVPREDATACPEGGASCGSGCTDLLTDRLNCGSCGTVCEVLEQCVAGDCSCVTTTGVEECDGVCVNTLTDNQHCGGCNQPCTGSAVCNGAGVCDVGCAGSYSECGVAPDIYCADLDTDTENCGACGRACAFAAHQLADCAGGTCTIDCESGWVDIDGNGDNGCECQFTSASELCDGLDNDCNGSVDETFDCIQNVGTRSCVMCGTQTCDSSCHWNACEPGGACDPTDPPVEQSCCATGTQTASCQADCTWGEWSACSVPENCTPGNEESVTCCGTGTATRTCGADCEWGGWGSCTVTGACTPGTAEDRPCCGSGSETRTCGDDCTWSGWSACSVTRECEPGTSESVVCCGTGTQTRTCDATCTWGAVSACTTGVCVPGETRCSGDWDVQTCQSNCTWGPAAHCTSGGTDRCCNGSTGACEPHDHPC